MTRWLMFDMLAINMFCCTECLESHFSKIITAVLLGRSNGCAEYYEYTSGIQRVNYT